MAQFREGNKRANNNVNMNGIAKGFKQQGKEGYEEESIMAVGF
jgi:hypothetical protein